MPYIPKTRRKEYEKAISRIVYFLTNVEENDAKGELNYIIFSIIKRYIDEKGLRYFRAQDFIGGTLTCCQMELYRRILGPYEDKAIEKNGDVE